MLARILCSTLSVAVNTEPQHVQVLLAQAEECKSRGNDLFKQQQLVEAIEEYDKALAIAPPDAKERAIYHANMAACHLALNDCKACIECCAAALRVNPDYLKALRRKMTAHEKLDELENALADAKRVRPSVRLLVPYPRGISLDV